MLAKNVVYTGAVPNQPLLEHRQNRFAARRGVGAEYGRHFILNDELGGLFVVGLRIGGAVFDDGLDLHALDAAFVVDFGNRHHRRVGERFFDDRQSAGQRKQHADLDGIGRLRGTKEEVRRRQCTGGAHSTRCLQKFPPIQHHTSPLLRS